jgi:hypothetical protein
VDTDLAIYLYDINDPLVSFASSDNDNIATDSPYEVLFINAPATTTTYGLVVQVWLLLKRKREVSICTHECECVKKKKKTS